jgi:arsenical pump membrane protein
VVAVAAAPARAAATAAQIWAPFVLVTGLLLIGAAADADGLFAAGGDRLARLPGRPLTLFIAALALVAAVTAVLNLDTAVVFVTPVLLVAAASRGIDTAAFLYGSVAMCNAASLLLPGANLTNLMVIGSRRVSGATFAVRMAPASVAAVVVTGVVLAVFFRRSLRTGAAPPDAGAAGAGVEGAHGPRARAAPLVVGPGLVATVAAAAIVLLTRESALFVLPLGIAAVLASHRLGRLRAGRLRAAVDLRPLLLLFLVALALGTLARSWSGPTRLLAGTTSGEAAALAAAASVLVNNLPAAALFSAHGSIDGRALLVGLDVGPNLAVTGALSALLWLRIARNAGQRPSVKTYSLVGVAVAPLAMAAAIVSLRLFGLGPL